SAKSPESGGFAAMAGGDGCGGPGPMMNSFVKNLKLIFIHHLSVRYGGETCLSSEPSPGRVTPLSEIPQLGCL
ncbi:MAG: hypothetical protein ACYTFT_06365, partial [Planctomycetota bacterium]